jgi:RHS repeat-associated protein
VSYSYDAVGDETGRTLTPAQGSSLTYSYGYDALRRLTTATNPVAPTTTYTLDADGNVTAISGYNGGLGAFTYSFDKVGQLLTQTDAQNDTYSYNYDPAGNLTQVTDPLNNVTTYNYDRQNNLLSVTNALNGVTSYSYNLAGWQTSETDPLNTLTQYSYDSAGYVTAVTNPFNNQQTYSYDAANELTGETNFDGQQSTYSYNLAGWQTGESWLNGQGQTIYQATYSYNAAGELTAASDPNSAYSYSYDNDGRLTQQVVTYPGLSSQALVTLTYGYDGFGDRTSLTDSLGGKVTYSYNGNFQLTGLTLALSGVNKASLTLSYDTQDRLGSVSRTAPGTGNATINSSYSYDSANRLLGITYTNQTNSTTLASFTYSYNADSLVSSYTGPEGTSSYSYDKLGELTGVTGAQAASYNYDANGNRTMSGYQTGTGNELLNDGQYSYTYDHAGNVLTKTDSAGNVWSYTWDTRGRLTQVVETNASHQTVMTEALTYDVWNNLIGVSVNGTQQRWTVYDGSNPYLDLTATGQVSQRYLVDPTTGALYGKVSSGGTADWYVTDAQGSVRQVVGSNGTVLDTITYDAYGNILSESSPSNGDRFKYAGGQYDSNLGLYLFGARWYSTSDGRWISQDPLGLSPDTNPYRYVDNSPINATDSSGLLPASLGGLVTSLFAGQVPGPIGLPERIYNRIVREVGRRAERAASSLALQRNIQEHQNDVRWRRRSRGSFPLPPANSLAIGLGITPREMDNAQDIIRANLARAGFSNINIQTSTSIQYIVAQPELNPRSGNVNWVAQIRFRVTATDSTGRRVESTIPFATRTGEYNDSTLVNADLQQ